MLPLLRNFVGAGIATVFFEDFVIDNGDNSAPSRMSGRCDEPELFQAGDTAFERVGRYSETLFCSFPGEFEIGSLLFDSCPVPDENTYAEGGGVSLSAADCTNPFKRKVTTIEFQVDRLPGMPNKHLITQ